MKDILKDYLRDLNDDGMDALEELNDMLQGIPQHDDDIDHS